jgi:hypothetical protein
MDTTYTRSIRLYCVDGTVFVFLGGEWTIADNGTQTIVVGRPLRSKEAVVIPWHRVALIAGAELN